MTRFNIQGAFLNAIMLGALVAVVCGVVGRFVAVWQPEYLVAASVLVAIEASIVHYTFRRDRMWLGELLRYLVPELTVMAVLMRVATTLSLGARTLSEDLRHWFFDPLSIFDLVFIVALGVGLIAGWLSHITMEDLLELEPQPGDAALEEMKLSGRVISQMNEERASALRHISSRFVAGGGLLLVALSAEAVNITRIGGPAREISALSVGAALLYVICGFLLYSQARLALLRARWRLEGAFVVDRVERRWTRSSWALIVGVALLAAILPRSYGLGLLDTLRALLGIVGYALLFLGYLVIWLFSLLALIPAWLLSLFAFGNPEPAPAPAPFQPPPPPPPAGNPELRLVPALIFWTCMLLLVGYAAWTVAQRNPALVRAVTNWGPLAALRRWLRGLWRDTRSWAESAGTIVRERLRRPVEVVRERRAAVRLSRFAPRELVRFFYRSTLRRAAERGLPRAASQTPYEYSQRLAEQLPESGRDIADLTGAFVEAQYSPRRPAPEEARRLTRPWARLRRRLRRPGGAGKELP